MPVPAPSPRRTGVAIWIAVAVVALVGLLLLLVVLGGGGRLPDELAGVPRSESDLVKEIEEAIESFEVQGISFDVAFYGEGPEPHYVAMVTDDIPTGPVGAPEDLLSSLPTGVVTGGQASLDFSGAVTETRDGVQYVCVPGSSMQAGQVVTMCLFQGEFVGFVVSSVGDQPAVLLEVAQEVYEAAA